MPSRELNRRLWTTYNWKEGGEEWSKNWGCTANLWHGTLMPRIGSKLGDSAVVEIAPGYGRLTKYLKDHCSTLTIVDIAENCIEFCRQRFNQATHIEYIVNDGCSLPSVKNESVDFVFSFDSLVHADFEVVSSYLSEINRVLSIGGCAFLHHSNLAALPKEQGKNISSHMRARDVSAEIVWAAANKIPTLECRTQELITWDNSHRLIDCLSTFIKCKHPSGTPVNRFENANFYNQARELQTIFEQYAPISEA